MRCIMPLRRFFLALIFLPALAWASPAALRQNPAAASRGLQNVTVLIVRHAEKPDEGRGLTAAGEQRASAYASYFAPLRLDGVALQPQRLIATSDSKSSDRPRLTLMPLATQLHLPLEQPYADKEVVALAESLRSQNTAPVILIAWHHGRMDDLVRAFGGDFHALTGKDKWPGDVYNWLIVLRFDAHGELMASGSKLVREHLMPGD